MTTKNEIRISFNGKEHQVIAGTTAGEFLAQYLPHPPMPTLAAIVHNRCVDLNFPLTADTEVRAVDYTSRLGVLVYRRTASLMLLEAIRQVLGPTRVKIDQALSNGYFYLIRTPGFDGEKAALLEKRMRELVAEDVPVYTKEVPLAEARRLFAERNVKSASLLLKNRWQTHVRLAFCGEFCTLHHFPLAPRASLITSFQVIAEPEGVVLRFPQRGTVDVFEPFVESPKLISVYRESSRWLSLLGVQTVGDLNEHVLKDKMAGELIRVAEGLHEKKIANIADQILARHDKVSLVLIAGPSSSGKTTFSKRLGLQLRVNGIRPLTLSSDDFYVNREDTPLDDDGKYDFEAIEAIDLPLFNDVLAKLLRGEEVLTPRFDFVCGQRRPADKWKPLKIEPGQVLIVEGIHGLNPRLTESIPSENKFRIYINALTQLCVDNHYRIYTSDTRLLRRLVRDRLFRGYSSAQTIEHWPKVRRGEMRNIYPFQDQADVMFDSALPYEHAVLRLYIERFLLEVPEEHPSFVEAFRLLRFIVNYVPLFAENIPQTSILREFIGGSYFDY